MLKTRKEASAERNDAQCARNCTSNYSKSLLNHRLNSATKVAQSAMMRNAQEIALANTNNWFSCYFVWKQILIRLNAKCHAVQQITMLVFIKSSTAQRDDGAVKLCPCAMKQIQIARVDRIEQYRACASMLNWPSTKESKDSSHVQTIEIACTGACPKHRRL